ncbi:TonB-dependent receptor [Chitinophagaceae bacterium LB-8]|uniref:TonB-dependent receptor n=1 Tax=Paraflavisolibacter caeni TaxID=2982496 RepID=A0A9X2XWB0_9BACT|nr:TonB-dependent receptor [Paraflavisolibacter caeni]MCU7548868.1 TonB-dependent receptor [Paraflavisolibacter caeni]
MKLVLPQWTNCLSWNGYAMYHSKFFRLLVLASLVLFTSTVFAQQRPVSGKVSVGDTALSGITVQVKGTAIATQTDANGQYTINAPADATLIFSSIGYGVQEVKLGNHTTLNVQMKSTTQQMNEVIVVGYGTQRKGTVTGAISNLKAEDIVRTPATSVSAALVGKMQGITARAPDARPGNGTNIQIRNMGNPLFVIDGIPYTGGNTGNTGFGFNQSSGQDVFNDIGLEDIESVTILKDASAAIYGLRAANGVVLVTTKKGKKNEAPTINLSGYYGLQDFTRYPKPGTAPQFVRAKLEAEQNSGGNPASVFTKDQYAKWLAGTDSGYKSYDYYGMVTRRNVPQYYLNASASGGSQRSNYYFSISHIDQDAMIRDFSYQRTNLQANLNTQLANRFQIGTQISAKVEKNHNVGVPGLDDYFNPLLSVFTMWPTEAPYANDNPNYINQTHNVNVNPATYKDDVTGWIDQYWRSMNVNLNAQYDFKFGLTARGTYSYNFQNEDFDGFEYTWNAYKYDAATGTYYTQPGFGNQNPWRERHKRNVINRYAQFQLNYNKSFGLHTIAAVAAYERSDYDNSYFVVHTVPTSNYVELQTFAEQDYLDDAWGLEARAGYIGRFNYNYGQKYLVELIGRYDGSYLYASDKRWGFFPAVSVGWRLTEESFFKNNLGRIFNDLKLRASYGETGSESGIGAFDYLPGYNFNNGSSVINTNLNNNVLTNGYVIGLRPRGLPITNLSWVTNRTKNIGIDFSILNGKITGQFDLFERKRTGLPAAKYDVLLPSEVGYTLPNENLNSDAHRGVEGIVTYTNNVGKVNYSIGANATVSRLRSLSTYKPRFENSWHEYRNSIEDRWADVYWGYHVIGQFQNQEEIDNYEIDNDRKGNRSMLPGDFKYQDVNGDKIINAMDARPIGYARGAQPYMSFGVNGDVSWKSFSLAFDFAGANMQSFIRDWELRYQFQNDGSAPAYMLEDRWHREDPYDPNSKWIPGKYPAIRKPDGSHSNHFIDGLTNDFWLTNVRYFRLKNLELSYTLPKALTKKAGISKMRVYANGTNLFSFDNVKDLEIDPEISSANGLVYPQQRLYNFGFNVTF